MNPCDRTRSTSPDLASLKRAEVRRRFKAASLLDGVITLADLLREAASAHHAFEVEHGPDEDWPTWYAKYLFGEEV